MIGCTPGLTRFSASSRVGGTICLTSSRSRFVNTMYPRYVARPPVFVWPDFGMNGPPRKASGGRNGVLPSDRSVVTYTADARPVRSKLTRRSRRLLDAPFDVLDAHGPVGDAGQRAEAHPAGHRGHERGQELMSALDGSHRRTREIQLEVRAHESEQRVLADDRHRHDRLDRLVV